MTVGSGVGSDAAYICSLSCHMHFCCRAHIVLGTVVSGSASASCRYYVFFDASLIVPAVPSSYSVSAVVVVEEGNTAGRCAV